MSEGNHPSSDDFLERFIAEVANTDEATRALSERTVTWLARDTRESQAHAAREADKAAASAFAIRVRARMHAARAERVLPVRALNMRRAEVRGTVAQSIQAATSARCAPLLELAAAAGNGRALWDEICEDWVEVAEESSSERHVAIRIAGDSMLPVLHPRDVILVKLDTLPVSGDLVVARLDDDGYVVKRFEPLDEKTFELSSFNPDYRPLVADRRSVSILGTVVARFHVNPGV